MKNGEHKRCLVCDDVSIGINFGVPTCMPCKAFFRRHARKQGTSKFICEDIGNCVITYKYRRLCNGCRLTKCFHVGMKESLILSNDEREARNKLVTINRLKRGKVPKVESIVWMQPPLLLRMQQNPCQHLFPGDQVVLANIFHAYENTCIVAKNTRFQSFPSIVHTSIHNLLNEMSPMFEIFIEYLKLIPEFNNLLIQDKIRIMRNHFGNMININQPLMYSVTPTNLLVTYTNVFNTDITNRLLKRNQIVNQFMFDPIVLRILLIIVVLSSGNCRNIDHMDMDLVCDDTLSIFSAQNTYVELLWRYILSRSSNERTVATFFNRLLMYILHVQNIGMCIDNYMSRFTQEIKQMEPMMQSMWPRMHNDESINVFHTG
ncbi:unnamed protein product [Rotaria magnacalcarata]|uniref:Nuclear receptor domain-containing protein n=1 Tax=Rotaria magnacalcarata TaxID=392030 RepID=A0A816UBQ3_9BILA|nr:unnamed protein product [Rotaria magnacalcarata]